MRREVDGNGVMIRRYVPLPGPDETLAMYDSTGVSYPLADSRGTPMAWTLANGQIAVQQYGAFGEEGPANIGRFGFTGHFCVGADRTTPLARRYDPRVRLPEISLDYYKARFYDPSIGRFLTPDPAGYIDSPNLYAYVLNDPVNNTDPSGLEAEDEGEEIVVTGRRRSGLGLFFGAFSSGGNIGSGSFFHFLDPLADNGSQGPGMGEMMAMERARERLCAQINDAANRTRSNLPTNPNARTVEGLRFERAVAQLDLQVIGPLANGLGLVSGAASTAPAGPVPGTTSLRFARAGVIVAFGAYVGQKLADRDMARIAAIDARLLQLDALASKVCR